MRHALVPCMILTATLCAACSSLLPDARTVTEGQWGSFQDAQNTFDGITPYRTTIEDLNKINLNPGANPNITILNYADVLRRFVPSASIDLKDLDPGVRDCVMARNACRGIEINQSAIHRERYGNFFADFFNFKRKTNITGWRFNGIVLIRDQTVVYKLTGGQPVLHEKEEATQPLGPFQGLGSSFR